MNANSHCLLAACAALTLGCAVGVAASTAEAADVFTLTSKSFADGQLLPKKAGYGMPNPQNLPNCVGENVAPEFSWSNAPDGTKSFVFMFTDPEGRGGTGLTHSVFYGIAVSVTGFAEGELSKPSDKYVGGKGTSGNTAYRGPCPQPKRGPHHYVFDLIATDLDPTELPPGLTREEIAAKLVPPGQTAHSKDVTSMVGRFLNPYPE